MPEELKEGYRWARHSLSRHHRDNWTQWVIVKITGKTPFLDADIVFIPDMGGKLGREPYESFKMNPEAWQFGPALNIPNEMWVDPSTQEMREKSTRNLRKIIDD